MDGPDDDAGNADSSTPQEGGAAEAAELDTAAGSAADASDSPPNAQDELDRQAFDRLAAEAATTRTGRARATPSPRAAATGQGTGEGAGKPATRPGADEGQAAQAQARQPGYDDLDDAGYQALARTKLLPPAKRWSETPAEVKANLVKAARAQISAGSRAFEAQRRLQQQQQNSSGRGGAVRDDGAAPTEGNDQRQGEAQQQQQTTGESETSGERRQAAGSVPARQAAAVKQQAPDFGALLKPAMDVLGLTAEQSAPIRSAFEQVQQHTEHLQQQHDQAMRQQHERYDAQLQQLAREHYGTQERRAIAAMKADKAFAGVDLDDVQVRTALLSNALIYHDVAAKSGQPISWEDAIPQAAHSMFRDELEQTAQRKLLAGQDASLRRTPERGTSRAAPPKAPTQDDIDDLEFERLAKKEADSQRRGRPARA